MKDIFVARQPIFDPSGGVVGHELLYRSSLGAEAAEGASTDVMSSTLIVDAVLDLGLDLLTDGTTAWINFTSDMILLGAADLLDPARVVIEVLEDVPPTPEIVGTLRALSERGYTIALDDWVHAPERQPLLALADIVKVDVEAAGDALPEIAGALRRQDVRLLAEKVESQEVHARCLTLGFELFQGFLYLRPETITRASLPPQAISIVRLMNLVQDAGAPDRRIEEGFRTDPGLTYKLLRLVNSAAVGGRGVESIGHAMRLLGREPIHRWLSLLLMTTAGGSGMRRALVKNALVRARMCELLGDHARAPGPDEVPPPGSLFLVGLFSQADQLMETPMETIVTDMDVAPAVRAALLGREGPAGAILKAVEAYEEAEWDRAVGEIASMGCTSAALSESWLDALAWAGDRLRDQLAAA